MNVTSEPLKKSTSAPWQEMDGQVLVLLPQYNTVHELNETAGFVWKNINDEITFEQLCTLLMDEFEVDLKTASQDLHSLVLEFKAKGLLVE